MTCDEVVEEVRSIFHDVGERARSEFGALTGEQLRWRPGPERWGIGQCLLHLERVGALYRDNLQDGLEKARAKGLERPDAEYRPGFLGRRFADAMAPGSGRQVRTSEHFEPGEVPDSVVSDFLDHLDAYDRLLDDAEGLDLSAVRVASPASRLIRLRVADALLLLANHERRHLQQALAVKGEPDFPDT